MSSNTETPLDVLIDWMARQDYDAVVTRYKGERAVYCLLTYHHIPTYIMDVDPDDTINDGRLKVITPTKKNKTGDTIKYSKPGHVRNSIERTCKRLDRED